jgi:hypothetical protein
MDFKKKIDIELMVYDMIEKIAEKFEITQKEDFEQEVYMELCDIFDTCFIDGQIQDFYCDNPEWEEANEQ